jgi:hypothetical protein
LADSRRPLRQGNAFEAGGSTPQVSLQQKEVFLHRFEFQGPDLGINTHQCLLELVYAGRCVAKQLVQLGRQGGFVTRQEPSAPNRRDLATKVCMCRIDLHDNRSGLALKPEDFDFPVHAFGDGYDGFIDGPTRDREFFLEASEEFEDHMKLKG